MPTKTAMLTCKIIFSAVDALDSEDDHFDFNANGAVDLQDLLAAHNHYGQRRQRPFLLLNPEGPAFTDVQIAAGNELGNIQPYFAAAPLDPETNAAHITALQDRKVTIWV